MLLIFFLLFLILFVLSLFIVVRLFFRCKQYDDLVLVMMDDVQENVQYLNLLLMTPMMSNSPEIVALRNNQVTMRDRFIELIENFERISDSRVVEYVKNKDDVERTAIE